MTSIYPFCIPKGMSHPQERIAQRVGVTQRIVESHLHKSSEMKNGVNEQLERGFGVNTIAEKMGWRGHW